MSCNFKQKTFRAPLPDPVNNSTTLMAIGGMIYFGDDLANRNNLYFFKSATHCGYYWAGRAHDKG